MTFLLDQVCKGSILSYRGIPLGIVKFLHLEEEMHVTIEDVEKAAAFWANSKHHYPMEKYFSKTRGKKFVLL